MVGLPPATAALAVLVEMGETDQAVALVVRVDMEEMVVPVVQVPTPAVVVVPVDMEVMVDQELKDLPDLAALAVPVVMVEQVVQGVVEVLEDLFPFPSPHLHLSEQLVLEAPVVPEVLVPAAVVVEMVDQVIPLHTLHPE
jgi:hypothetical protein